MDVAIVIGFALAWGALFLSLGLEGGVITDLVNLPAFVLVIFGTIGATVVGTSIKTLTSLPAILRSAMVSNDIDPAQVIKQVTAFARLARREGVLALESSVGKIENKFLKKGVELVIDGTPSITVREILETEIVAMQERHKIGETVFTTLGGFSPTLGIIGTVMGLISMLSKLNEPSKMGHAIAAAFVATLYGVALANLVYLPIAAKLRSKTSEEVVVYEMIVEGIMSIQSGDAPRTVETRMMAYLPPDMRTPISGRGSADGRSRLAA